MDGTNLDLDTIATFVRVAELGGISPAARRLKLPKSTVSRRLRRLEQELGVRLVQRSSRQVRLTGEGEGFYQRVASAIARLEEAATWVGEESREVRGSVRLTAPQDFGGPFLTEMLVEFLTQYPQVQIETELTNRQVDVVAEGFDLAVRAGVLPDSSLIARKIVESELWVAASPKLLARTGHPLQPAELRTLPCVLFRSRGRSIPWQLVGPEGEVTVEVTGQGTTNEFGFCTALVRAGLGFGLLPSFVVQKGIRSGELHRVLPGWSSPGGAVYLITPTRHLTRRVQLLRDHLAQRMSEILLEKDNGKTTKDNVLELS